MSTGAGYIPPVAAEPASGSCSTASAGLIPDVAVGPRCPEPGRHPERPQRKCPAASAGGPFLSSTDHWVAMPAGHRPCSLAAAVPVVAPVQTRIRLCVAQVATSRWLPRDPRRVHTDDQRVGGDPILSGASAPWTPARPSTPAWPGVRTPAARRAVVRAAVPEAADGQSVDRSGSLQLSLRFLDAGLRRSSLR